MKKKLLASVLLAASLVTLGAASAARAEPLPSSSTTILDTVDSATVLVNSTNDSFSVFRVEGIVSGESSARELDLQFSSGTGMQQVADRCLKFMLLSQSHPGRYSVTFKTNGFGSTISCKLKSR